MFIHNEKEQIQTIRKSHPFYIVEPSAYGIFISVFAGLMAFHLVNYFHTGNAEQFQIYFFSFAGTIGVWFFIISKESEEPYIYTKAVRENYILGVLLFIISEIMIFFAFFWTYLHSSLNPSVYIGSVWPPYNIKPMNSFHWPLFNTTILLLSGLTVNVFYYTMKSVNMLKVRKCDTGYMLKQIESFLKNNKNFIFCYENKNNFPNGSALKPSFDNKSNSDDILSEIKEAMGSYIKFVTKLMYTSLIYTIIFGAIFIYCQYHEYKHASFDITDGIYGSIFYSLTGLHGAHVIIGVCLLIVVLIRFINKDFSYTFSAHEGVTASVWYWHFVDLVWIFVYFIVYLWGNWILT